MREKKKEEARMALMVDDIERMLGSEPYASQRMKPDPRRAFGERLRALRKKAGKTLGDVAEVLGVSVVYVSDVERGNRPPLRPDLIDNVAIELGAEAGELHKLAAEVRGAFELLDQMRRQRDEWRDQAEQMQAFLHRLDGGGTIVPYSAISGPAYAIAKEAGRVFDTPDGRRLIYVPGPTPGQLVELRAMTDPRASSSAQPKKRGGK